MSMHHCVVVSLYYSNAVLLHPYITVSIIIVLLWYNYCHCVCIAVSLYCPIKVSMYEGIIDVQRITVFKEANLVY